MTIKGGRTRKDKVIPLTTNHSLISLTGHKTLIHKSKSGKVSTFIKNKKGTRRYIRR